MARKDPPIERLGDVLETSLKRLDLNARLDDYGIWTIWNQTVGAAIARNAQPEKIRNGTLMVKVSSPVWMQQLQFMKEMIADKLNEQLQSTVVKNIFFVVGRIDVPADEAPPPQPSTPPRLVDASFIETIDDPEIRDAFKKLLNSFARRQTKPK
nr:K203 [uncultured bacterium]